MFKRVGALALALILAACTTSGEIDGQEITVTSYSPVIAGAPQWLRDYWGKYLRHAEATYTVMAVDRNLRSAAYVYCQGGGCHNLIGSQHKSFKDVYYKNEALKNCREQTLKEYPGQKPDCEVFAIRDKIVWRGPLPWE